MTDIKITNELYQHVLGVLLRTHGTLERQMNGTAQDTYEVWEMCAQAYDKLHALQPTVPQAEGQQGTKRWGWDRSTLEEIFLAMEEAGEESNSWAARLRKLFDEVQHETKGKQIAGKLRALSYAYKYDSKPARTLCEAADIVESMSMDTAQYKAAGKAAVDSIAQRAFMQEAEEAGVIMSHPDAAEAQRIGEQVAQKLNATPVPKTRWFVRIISRKQNALIQQIGARDYADAKAIYTGVMGKLDLSRFKVKLVSEVEE
jgi:hypothetical protein